VAGEGGGGVLRLEEGKGKVRDHLAEEKRRAGSSSPWEGIDGDSGSKMWRGEAAAWSPTRTRGRGGCARASSLREEVERGRK
jgi:hypothetical protein